jgi:DNA-binding transcriptional regulator YiaG
LTDTAYSTSEQAGLTQDQRISHWKQGRREPDVTARLLLRVIEHAPELVEQVVRQKA